jgi:quercetin dioxygenase-like cupin family protein
MPEHQDFASVVHLRSEDTADVLGLIEVSVPARWPGPPLHHHAFDETFHVLAGELTFQVGDELIAAGAGTTAFAPRDAVHTLANHADAPARYLLICTPGGFERRFDRLAPDPPPSAAKSWPETTTVGPQIDPARPVDRRL